ncbi:NAD(P)H-binding protein [Polymorphospora rubra]|uniref:NAD(P)-dependent oxidoreductase n=1 Tax=Polymorphospora rubra TaxID=338584 RepID=A0A810N408_9ACTN|nr:NAD(P)H-binding protein [Polymorphospora rubra]BCJ68202.1 NAD(P)-dependent oxidoreductase [Polymorphospora rubra]
MIVVSAASGALGRLVVERLLTRLPADQVGAAVRAPDRAADLAALGVDVRHGDYDDPASLRSAFAGARRLLLISSPELAPDRRIRQQLGAVEAAVASGVRAVAYTSFLGADRDGGGLNAAHHATERAIVDSGLGYTILRHPFYTEAFVNAGLRAAAEAGRLVSGTGGRGLNTALRTDLAEAAVNVLTDDDHLGRGYDLTGPLWTYPQLARELGDVTGTKVEYHEDAGAATGPMAFLEGLARAGALERQTDDLRRVLGRPPTSLRRAVQDALGRVDSS